MANIIEEVKLNATGAEGVEASRERRVDFGEHVREQTDRVLVEDLATWRLTNDRCGTNACHGSDGLRTPTRLARRARGRLPCEIREFRLKMLVGLHDVVFAHLRCTAVNEIFIFGHKVDDAGVLGEDVVPTHMQLRLKEVSKEA
jgi:hypothetical protein